MKTTPISWLCASVLFLGACANDPAPVVVPPNIGQNGDSAYQRTTDSSALLPPDQTQRSNSANATDSREAFLKFPSQTQLRAESLRKLNDRQKAELFEKGSLNPFRLVQRGHHVFLEETTQHPDDDDERTAGVEFAVFAKDNNERLVLVSEFLFLESSKQKTPIQQAFWLQSGDKWSPVPAAQLPAVRTSLFFEASYNPARFDRDFIWIRIDPANPNELLFELDLDHYASHYKLSPIELETNLRKAVKYVWDGDSFSLKAEDL